MIQELEYAERLANVGLLTDAEVASAHAIRKRSDVAVFISYGRFLERLGRFVQAEEMFQSALDFSLTAEDRARAYNHLGHIHGTHGDLARAEGLYHQAFT